MYKNIYAAINVFYLDEEKIRSACMVTASQIGWVLMLLAILKYKFEIDITQLSTFVVAIFTLVLSLLMFIILIKKRSNEIVGKYLKKSENTQRFWGAVVILSLIVPYILITKLLAGLSKLGMY